jgi:hypothetical protein
MKKLTQSEVKLCIKHYDKMRELLNDNSKQHLSEAERFLDAIAKTIEANKPKKKQSCLP